MPFLANEVRPTFMSARVVVTAVSLNAVNAGMDANVGLLLLLELELELVVEAALELELLMELDNRLSSGLIHILEE
ncbi:MAG: hypothetical protein PHG85_02155 [Candidatus Altiarchaeota archaeon]|nr:hypothetical protein [Candidatus Altiarchaeota archaeon]